MQFYRNSTQANKMPMKKKHRNTHEHHMCSIAKKTHNCPSCPHLTDRYIATRRTECVPSRRHLALDQKQTETTKIKMAKIITTTNTNRLMRFVNILIYLCIALCLVWFNTMQLSSFLISDFTRINFLIEWVCMRPQDVHGLLLFHLPYLDFIPLLLNNWKVLAATSFEVKCNLIYLVLTIFGWKKINKSIAYLGEYFFINKWTIFCG